MALDKAHEGYEYQDLLTAYFMLKEILNESNSAFRIDRQEFTNDRWDDLSINNSRGRFKKQIKFSNNTTNHTFVKDNISADGTYGLSLSGLYKSWETSPDRESTEFRLCLGWNEPTDTLVKYLTAVPEESSFIDFPTKLFKVKGESVWPEGRPPDSSWRQFRSESAQIDRNLFLRFCNQLLIEVELPKFSLNLQAPGDLEVIVLEQAKKLGIGVYPNQRLQPVEFVLHLLAIIKRARSKGELITEQSVFRELSIITDYGKIEQQFPVVKAENISVNAKLKALVEKIISVGKAMLLGEPGSGKSWFLENLGKYLEKKEVRVVRHYCYTNLDDVLQLERIKLNSFYGNLIYDIIRAYPKLKDEKNAKYASNLEELNLLLSKIDKPTFLIIDGLDHIERIVSFKNYTNLPESERDIIGKIKELKPSPQVKILVASQNIVALQSLQDFQKITVPKWGQGEIAKLLTKLRFENSSVGGKEATTAFLLEKSDGNPLYVRYLIEELKRDGPNVANLPPYSFNLKNYYQYLLTKLNTREQVAQVLSGVDFNLTEVDLEEITDLGDYVQASLEILLPVLKHNISQKGYLIYHESFRRFIIEELKARSVSIEKKVFQPVVEWFSTKNLFEHRKSYHFALKFLYECGKPGAVLHYLKQDYVTESVVHGYAWQAIENNYKYFVKAACEREDFPNVILLNEIDKILALTRESFEEIFSVYIEALGNVHGFDRVREYLSFDGGPTFDTKEGLSACYVCDTNGVAAPWELYLSRVRKARDKEILPFCIRGLLVLQNGTKLNELAKLITGDTENTFQTIYRQELLKYKPTDYVDTLCQKYPSIRKLVRPTKSKVAVDEQTILDKADRIVGFEHLFSDEGSILHSFLTGFRQLSPDSGLLKQLKSKFAGKSWFYNWLMYYLEIIELTNRGTSRTEEEVTLAFEHLTKRTDPFEGKPKASDLYSIESLLQKSFREGLCLVESASEWTKVIDILITASNNTSVSYQRSQMGPLSTESLFKLLTEFANEKNRHHLLSVFERLANEKKEYHLHSDIAGYIFRLVPLFASIGEKDKAQTYFRNGVEYALGYTMRKDLTLVDVIQGIEFYSQVEPEQALKDIRVIKDMVDSAVGHTDGKETYHFPIEWFASFAKVDLPNASLFLLHQLSNSRYNWQAEDSLIELLVLLPNHISPEIQFYLAITFPVTESEKFVTYCLNLHDILLTSNPALADKLLARIIVLAQPRQNKSLSQTIIDRLNRKIVLGQLDSSLLLPPQRKYSNPGAEKWYQKKLISRKGFSEMPDFKLNFYLEEQGVLDKDIPSLYFKFLEQPDLTDSLKQVIQTIVRKNTDRLTAKHEIDYVFSTGKELECYYWVCVFVYEYGGHFERFTNQEAFSKAYALDVDQAIAYLFELLSPQLDIGFNFQFSVNILRALVTVGYDKRVIAAMWRNLFSVSRYRLPFIENTSWDEVLANEVPMDSEEILLCMIICRYKAGTSERYQWTTSALNYFFRHHQSKLIKPLQWFFKHQDKFLSSVLVIILQLLLQGKKEGSDFYLTFEPELQALSPKRHFQIDDLLQGLIATPLALVQTNPELVYPDSSFEIYWYLVGQNQRLLLMNNYGLDLQSITAHHVATFRARYGGLLELYANKVFRISIPNVYISEYLSELINTKLYLELAAWQRELDDELFASTVLIDTNGMLSYINSFTQRPIDLLKPHLYTTPHTITPQEEQAEWVRLGHYETEMIKQGYGQASKFKSFGGIVFLQTEIETLPYSETKPLSFFFWNNELPGFGIDSKPVFSIIQSDSLECFNLLWLNPTIVKFLILKIAITQRGLVAVDPKNEVVLKMRTWTSEYLTNGHGTNLSEEIPALQGTDLLIRKDYFNQLLALYSVAPTYQTLVISDRQ